MGRRMTIGATRSAKRIVTDEQIEAAKSPRGAWTKATLASWGVPWPPPKGWRTALRTGKPIPRRGQAKRTRAYLAARRKGEEMDSQWCAAMERDR